MANNIVAKHVLEVAVGLQDKSKQKFYSDLTSLMKNAGNKSEREFATSLVEAINLAFKEAGNSTSFNIAEFVNVEGLGKQIGEQIVAGLKTSLGQIDLGSSGNLAAQLQELEKRKIDLKAKDDALWKKKNHADYLEGITSMEPDEFKSLKINGDIDEQALAIMGAFTEAEDALSNVTKGTKEYNIALIKAMQAASKLYSMRNTLEANRGSVKDKSIFSDYSLDNLTDITFELFEESDNNLHKALKGTYKAYEREQEEINAALDEIDARIKEINAGNSELLDQAKADAALKTLEEIDQAYSRILNKNGKDINQKKQNNILSALNYTPGDKALTTLSKGYSSSIGVGEDWEVQYQWLVKFVKEYEAYAASEKVDKSTLSKYTELYQSLKPMAQNAEESLRRVIGAGSATGASAEAVSKIEAEAIARDKNTESIKEETVAKKELNDVDKAVAYIFGEDATGIESIEKKTEAIKKETEAEKELIETSSIEGENETLQKENGTLEEKLELLQDIANEYGNQITQKNRDRYEELNQKDMDSGLSTKEEDRYYELGEQIDNADEALAEFEKTYDRIILKLANGKKVEILPNDKGLRDLYAFSDEGYGADYKGTDVEDVIFERAKQESAAIEDTTEKVYEKIKSYEELEAVVDRYNSLMMKKFSENGTSTKEDDKELSEINNRFAATKGVLGDPDKFLNFEMNMSRSQGPLGTVQLKNMSEFLGIPNPNAEEEARIAAEKAEAERLASEEKKKQIKLAEEAKTKAEEESRLVAEKAESERLATEAKAEAKKEVAVDVAGLKGTSQTVPTSALEASQLTDTLAKVNDACQNIVQACEVIKNGIVSDRAVDTAKADDIRSLLQSLSNSKLSNEQLYFLNSQTGKFSKSSYGDSTSVRTELLDKSLYDTSLHNHPIRGTAVPSKEDLMAMYYEVQEGITKGLITTFDEILSIDFSKVSPELTQKILDEMMQAMILPDDLSNSGLNMEIGGEGYELVSQFVLGAIKDVTEKYGYGDILTTYRSDGELDSALRDSGVKDKSFEINEVKNRLKLVDGFGTKITEDPMVKSGEYRDLIGEAFTTVRDMILNGSLPDMQSAMAEWAYQTTGEIVERTDDGSPIIENDKAPWALESTLQTVQSVLQEINTSLKSRPADAKPAQSTGTKSESSSSGSGKTSQPQNNSENKSKKNPPSNVEKDPLVENAQKYYDLMLKARKSQNSPGYVDELQKELATLESTKSTLESIKGTEKESAELKKMRVKYEQDLAKVIDAEASKEVKKSRANAKFGRVETVLGHSDDLKKQINSSDYKVFAEDNNDVKDFMLSLQSLRSLYEQIYHQDGVVSEKDINSLQAARNETEEYRKKVEALFAQLKLGANEEDTGRVVGENASTYYAQLSKMAQELEGGRAKITGFNSDTNTLNYTVKTGAHELTNYSLRVTDLNKNVIKSTGSVKRLEGMFESIKRKTKEIFTYFSGSSIIFKAFNEIRQGITYVKEIDSALTELKKVTDETEETYDRFLNTASKTAAKVGSTLRDFTQATSEFARLGYNIEQASDMAEAALVYKNVGDGISSVQEASESIISTLKAFNIEATDSMNIVSKFNEVGNNFAITSKGIGDALQKSASALEAAGNSLDESIGLITGANTVVQNPESVGQALKTLSLRIRGAKVELEEAGESTDDMATSVSSLQKKILALTGNKVDIMLDGNTFKNTTEILREMSAVWDDMSDVSQASALELLGGKRQANILASIINNFDTVEEAIKSAQDAEGSALRENQKYMDSIQGRIDQFNNALQTMWKNLLDDSVIKWVVDLGTKFIKFIDTIGLTGVAVAGLVLQIVKLSVGAKSVGAAFITILKPLVTIGTTGKTITATVAAAGSAAGGAAGGFASLAAAAKAAGAGVVAFFSTPLGWLTIAAAGIATVVYFVDKYTTSVKEASQATEEAMNAYKESQSALKSNKATIDEVSEDYEKLSKGVDQFGNNLSLTTDEYARYNEIVGQIADMFPEMVTGWTKEGNAILSVKGNVEELTQAYKDAADASDRELIAKSNEIFTTFKNDYSNNPDTTLGGKTGLKGQSALANKMLELIEEGNADNINKFWADLNAGNVTIDGEKYSNIEKKDLFKSAGINEKDFKSFWDGTINIDKLKEQKRYLDNFIKSSTSEITAAMTPLRTLLSASLTQDLDYKQLDDNVKLAAQNIVSSLDAAFLNEFNNATEMQSWIIENVVKPLQDASSQEEFKAVFDLQTKFNGGDMPVEEYESAVKNLTQYLIDNNFDDEIIKSIKVMFNVDDTGLYSGNLQEKAKSLLNDEGDTRVGEFTKSDLDIIDKYAAEFEEDIHGVAYSWDELNDKIKEKRLSDSFSAGDFDGFSDTIDKIQSAYSSLSDAIEQYNSTGYLTLDNLQAILSMEPEYLACLQMENGQLSINQAAMEAMIQTKLNEAKATAIEKAMVELNSIAKGENANATVAIGTAADGATSGLSNLSSWLNQVSIDAINAANDSAQFMSVWGQAYKVDSGAAQQVLSNLNTTLGMIDSVGAGLHNNFGAIMGGGSGSGSGGGSEKEDDAFERAMTYWENRISASEARYEQVQNEVDLLEKKGKRAGAEYYEEQIKLSEQKRSLLEAQRSTAEQFLNGFEEGSEDWWKAASKMNDLEGQLDEITASVLDLQDAIGAIKWDTLEEFTNRVDTLHDSLSNIRDMFDEDDWFDEVGGFTETGTAALGTYIQELEIYENELKGINDELSNLSRPYVGNEDYYANLGLHSEQELYDKYSELQSQQNDYRQGIKDTQDAVVDMYSSQIDAVEAYHEELTSAYSDYISYLKETLDAERSLYEFKKNIQQQSKDIAETERKIASLSGSTSQADIAERRRLQKTLYDQRNELETSYRDNARDAQIAALEAEQTAYEDATTRYIETLKTTLKNASKEISDFMSKVSALVLSNSDTVLKKYQETGLEMDEALTHPWEVAIEKIEEFGGPAGLGVMNSWTAQGGFFNTFMNAASAQLQTPWAVGIEAVNVFSDSVAIAMSNVLAAVQSNIQSASYSLASLYAQIQDTALQAAAVGSGMGGGFYGGGGGGGAMHSAGTTSWVNGHKFTNESVTYNGTLYVKDAEGYWLDAKYVTARTSLGSVPRYQYFAKGTTGTKKDQWAITDEPQYGDELTLVPGKDGILQYMKKGTGVVPADLTKSLMDIGAVGLDGLMNANQLNSGVNIINTAVTKPNYEFSFDALVKADHIDENAVPALKKMVTEELDKFARQLNYSLKLAGAH